MTKSWNSIDAKKKDIKVAGYFVDHLFSEVVSNEHSSVIVEVFINSALGFKDVLKNYWDWDP